MVNVLEDELSGITDDPNHDYLYTIAFCDDELEEMDFRYDDLKPL